MAARHDRRIEARLTAIGREADHSSPEGIEALRQRHAAGRQQGAPLPARPFAAILGARAAAPVAVAAAAASPRAGASSRPPMGVRHPDEVNQYGRMARRAPVVLKG